jgi:tetratricopeptide (TPR) repeat protein
MTSTSLKEPIAAPTGANAEKEAQLHASLGQLLLRQERYAQAVNELTAALEAKPDQPAWLASRAEANEHLGAVYKAVDDAAAAVMAAPTNAEYAALLARLLQRAGRHDEAVLSFSEAIRLDDSKVEYYEGLARALWIKGSLPAATELYERLRLADPDNESYHLLLAEIYMQDQQPAKAAELCQAALDHGLKSPLIYRAYGHAKLVAGDRA